MSNLFDRLDKWNDAKDVLAESSIEIKQELEELFKIFGDWEFIEYNGFDEAVIYLPKNTPVVFEKDFEFPFPFTVAVGYDNLANRRVEITVQLNNIE